MESEHSERNRSGHNTPTAGGDAVERDDVDTDPVPFLDMEVVHKELFTELRVAFERVLASGTFVMGPELEGFESVLARHTGTRFAIGVGSGIAALQLALMAARIGPGDEVILPPNTFFATAEAVAASGAVPVFADVDPRTALIDPNSVEAAISDRTAAIIAVHLYGQPAPMDRLAQICRRHHLFLLEDAAQAISSTWNGRPAGSLGDAGAFSFYPGKNLGALGDAGAVTTDDPQLARRVSILRSHGEATKHVHLAIGFNERLDELQAAFLTAKFAQLGSMEGRRRRAVARYETLLAELDEVAVIDTAPQAGHGHHLFVVVVPRRDEVLKHLLSAGIGAMVHYPTPIHLQPAFRESFKHGSRFPEAERLATSVLSLPLFPGISDGQVGRVVKRLAAALAETR